MEREFVQQQYNTVTLRPMLLNQRAYSQPSMLVDTRKEQSTVN